MNLTELSKQIHQNAREKGFYDIDDKIENWNINNVENIRHSLTAQKIALIHSELSEALEADRKNRKSSLVAFERYYSSNKKYNTNTNVEDFKKIIK